jgi:predicted metal-dependent peptidase
MGDTPEIFAKSKVKMILKHPFFAVLALHLAEKKADKSLSTTATDGKNLFVNEDWAKKLDDDEKLFVLGHEVLHCAFGHLWRRGTRDPERFNIAADYAINLVLQKAGLKPPKEVLLDQKYDGMSAEEIYDKLPKDMKGKKPLCVMLKGAGGGEDSPDSKGCAGHQHGEGDVEIEVPNQKEMETEWKGLLAEAATTARMQGKMPEGLDRLIKDILEPKMRWDQLLDQLISEVTRDDYDDQYPDRRLLAEHGLYFPDLKSEKRYIAIAIDTSGSIGQDELKAFVSETAAIVRSRGVSRVRIMSCDAAVHMDRIIEPQDELPGEYPGGGGTSFVPVFKRLEEDGATEKPALLVYFTDSYGEFPDHPPEYPVMWVVKGGEAKNVPFGIACQYETSEVEVR